MKTSLWLASQESQRWLVATRYIVRFAPLVGLVRRMSSSQHCHGSRKPAIKFWQHCVTGQPGQLLKWKWVKRINVTLAVDQEVGIFGRRLKTWHLHAWHGTVTSGAWLFENCCTKIFITPWCKDWQHFNFIFEFMNMNSMCIRVIHYNTFIADENWTV